MVLARWPGGEGGRRAPERWNAKNKIAGFSTGGKRPKQQRENDRSRWVKQQLGAQRPYGKSPLVRATKRSTEGKGG